MADGWTITAAVASAVSAGVALWGVVLIIRANRRQAEADTPLLEFEISGTGTAGIALRMRASNRSPCRWRFVEIEIVRPSGATIAKTEDLTVYDPASSKPLPVEDSRARFQKRVPLAWELQPGGSGRSASGSSDIIWREFAVRAPMPVERVRLRVCVRSLEPTPRKITRTVIVSL